MDWQDRIENKLDQINIKLDNHLERLSHAEEAIIWMKGHIKIVTTLAITVIGLIVTAMMQFIGGK